MKLSSFLHLICGLAGAALTFAAAGQSLYRCQSGDSIVFSENPCGANAQRQQLDGQAPSATDAAAAHRRAAAAASEGQRIDQAVDDRLARQRQAAAAAARSAENINVQAEACVDRYRPHLAYNAVRVESKRIETDGFGRTLYVNVRTITNPNTPARIDPILLTERFICRLTPQGGIDDRWTEDYVNRHKRGQRL